MYVLAAEKCVRSLRGGRLQGDVSGWSYSGSVCPRSHMSVSPYVPVSICGYIFLMHGGMAAQWGASQGSGGCHPTKGTSGGVFRTPPKGKDTPESGCGEKTLGQSRGVLCRDPPFSPPTGPSAPSPTHTEDPVGPVGGRGWAQGHPSSCSLSQETKLRALHPKTRWERAHPNGYPQITSI